MQKSDNGKEEITIVESNKVFLKENEVKDRYKNNSFLISTKSNQLNEYIKIAA